MKPPRLALFAASPHLVTFAAGATGVEASESDRTLSGLVVPFGPTGSTGDGLLRFRPGSLTWASDVRRIKLLLEHDQHRPVGHAVAVEERPEGVYATFRIPEGDEGDRVLRDAAEGLRDGLSVGVQLDAATHSRLRRAAQGQAVDGSGVMRESSLVTVPAFDDARLGTPALVGASGAGGLTRMTTPQTPPPPAPGDPAPPPAPPAPGTPPAPPAPADPPVTQAAATPTTAVATPTTAAGPGVVRAVAGAALAVLGEPSTYRFDGSGSLVRDAYAARFEGDLDAGARVRRFNNELRAGNPSSVAAFITASGALTTAQIASPATTDDVELPAVFLPQNNRPDLMLRAVDLGRPIVSRLNRVPITNAQPFLVPIEGEFDGVGDHTEGTPHVAEGTFTLADAPVTPRAVSGAYRISRELADATNPAIDQIVLRAMLRDYRRVSEQKVVDALLAADATPTVNVNTAMELRAALVGFVNDDDETADFVAVGRGLLGALYAEVDTTGRPILAGVGTAPTAATPRAGYTGLAVDGTEVIRSGRIPTDRGVIVRAAGVLFVESNVQQFRFDEIEGPGILKLALWAYVGAAVLEADAVEEITSAAA